MAQGMVQSSFFCIWTFNCPRTIYLKDYPFSTELHLHPCFFKKNLVIHLCVGLFMDSLFVPLIYLSIIRPIPPCPDYCSFIIGLEIREYQSSNFALFQNCLGLLGPLRFHTNFSLSISQKEKRCGGTLYQVIAQGIVQDFSLDSSHYNSASWFTGLFHALS